MRDWNPEEILADFPDLQPEYIQVGRLLLDENLSPRHASALATQFPGRVQVRDVDLKGPSHHQIWAFQLEPATRSPTEKIC